MKPVLYRTAGVLSLLLGLIGIPLPLLPTTPFLLLAAWCFARSSPALEARLLAHPTLGPPIRRWRDHGAIPLRAKQIATLAMLLSCLLAWFTASAPWRYVPIVVAMGVLTFIWTRPHR